MKNKFTLLLLPLVISGCISLEPKYQRPVDVIPVEFTSEDTTDKIVIPEDLYWKNYVQNIKLEKVIETSLINNKDLSIAISNIEFARAKYGIEKSNRLPNISIDYTGQKGKAENKIDNAKLDVTMTSYELDIFGRVKNLSKAALEEYLNTEESRNAKEILVRSEVIKAYYDVAYYKSAYEISQNTENSTYDNLNLVQKRLDNGLAREKDLNDAKTLYFKAKSERLMYLTNIEKSINNLNYIVGEKIPEAFLPKNIKELNGAIKDLKQQFSSEILLNRPDILSAEHTLKSKNANIGAARAAFFPRISLTASNGIASNDLSALFNNNYNTWSVIPNISIPIFNGGKNQSNLDMSKAEKDIALKTYEQTLQKAFYEVLDELAIKSNINERIDSYDNYIKANKQSYLLANKSYELGVSSYLEVLVAQQSLYNAEIQDLSLKREEFYNKISLYKVLGY